MGLNVSHSHFCPRSLLLARKIVKSKEKTGRASPGCWRWAVLPTAGPARHRDLPPAFPRSSSCLRSNIYLRRRLCSACRVCQHGELAEQDAQPVCSLRRRRRLWKSRVTGCFSSCFKYAGIWWSRGIWGAGLWVRACSMQVEVRDAGWCRRLQGGIQARAPQGQQSLLTALQLHPGRKQPLPREHHNVSTPT